MFPYAILFTISSLFATLGRSKAVNRLLAAIFASILVIFVGTRLDVGCDFASYERRFNFLDPGLTWGEMFNAGESGFYLMSLGLRDLGYSHLSVLFVSGVIYLFCLWRFSRLLEKPLGFLALSFPILIVQLGMSGIRQALALGLLLLAMSAFANKKRLMVLLWVLLASQFHTSAIIFLPLAYLPGREVSLGRLVAAMALLGPAVLFVVGERAEVYSERYVEQTYGENSSGGAWFRYTLILIPFLLFEWKQKLVEQAFPKLYPLLRVFALITFAMAAVGLVSSVALHRLVFYAMPISIMAFICVSQVLAVERKNPVMWFLPYAFYGVYFIGWFKLSRHADLCYTPYQSWLF
jgi:hypothetical protein